MLKVVLGSVAVAGSLVFFAAGDAPKFKDAQVRQAQERFEQAKNGYRLALDRALAKVDDAEAGAMRDAIAALDAFDAGEPVVHGADAPPSLVGTWKITYSNRGTRTYLIARDGRVRFVEENKAGRIVMRDGDALVDFGDDKLERLSIAPALALEHFNPASSYPRGTPAVTGTGVQVR